MRGAIVVLVVVGAALWACDSDDDGEVDAQVAGDCICPDVTPDAAPPPPEDMMAPGDMREGDQAVADAMADDAMPGDALPGDALPGDAMLGDAMPPADAMPPDAAVDASVACAEEGEAIPVVPGAPECCAGLFPTSCDAPLADGTCPEGCDGASICTACGDGRCGLGENICNCPLDCDDAACAGAGEVVPVVPGAPMCCQGLSPIGCDRPAADGSCGADPCVGAFVCAACGDGVCGPGENPCNCAVDCAGGGECVGEGDSVPVVPNAPQCCPNLTPVGCEVPDANGVCQECVGASRCTRCGDGQCGVGENICNCPDDCDPNVPCRDTVNCLFQGAPIRCLGAWRCDPNHTRPSDADGERGCTYTCWFNLPDCVDGNCAGGDICAPCPQEGGACGDRDMMCFDPGNL
ncbi:MAG: hypothetical protein KC620_06475 [Myxococcales bacterium]|nr:hypothetical protein [Myxococcales bacterium]